jgi:hypothetical protein
VGEIPKVFASWAVRRRGEQFAVLRRIFWLQWVHTSLTLSVTQSVQSDPVGLAASSGIPVGLQCG